MDQDARSADQRYQLKLYVDKTIHVDPADMEAKHVARFKDLVDDQDVFADIKNGNPRRHFHVISEDSHLGPARITTPHHFHMSYLEVPPGVSANIHAHAAPEIFIPMTGRFQIIYNDNGTDAVDLEPLDAVSVPVGLMRTFKNVGTVNGLLMVIYDGPGEVLGKIYVSAEEAEKVRRESPKLAEDILAD